MCVDCWEHFERDSNTWPVVVRCRHATWPRPRKIWERWPLSCNKERRQSGTRHFFCVPASSRKNCQVEWLLAVSVSPSPLSLQHKNRKVGQLTPPPPHPPTVPTTSPRVDYRVTILTHKYFPDFSSVLNTRFKKKLPLVGGWRFPSLPWDSYSIAHWSFLQGPRITVEDSGFKPESSALRSLVRFQFF